MLRAASDQFNQSEFAQSIRICSGMLQTNSTHQNLLNQSELALGCLRPIPFDVQFELNYNQSVSALGCLRPISEDNQWTSDESPKASFRLLRR